MVVDFTEDFQAPPTSGELHAATLKVYWVSNLTSTRRKGRFKVKVSDMIKWSSDPDARIASLEDVKGIDSKDARRDTGW